MYRPAPAASGASGTAYISFVRTIRSSLGSATTKIKADDRKMSSSTASAASTAVGACRCVPLASTQTVTKRTAHSHPYNLYGRTSFAINQEMARASSVNGVVSKLVLHMPNKPKHTLLKSRAEAPRFVPPQYQTTTCNVIGNCGIATMPRNRRA